jgi:hypothetical protein
MKPRNMTSQTREAMALIASMTFEQWINYTTAPHFTPAEYARMIERRLRDDLSAEGYMLIKHGHECYEIENDYNEHRNLSLREVYDFVQQMAQMVTPFDRFWQRIGPATAQRPKALKIIGGQDVEDDAT